MRRQPKLFCAAALLGLFALPAATAAGATWNGGTDTWTDADNGPWSGSAPGAGDAAELTQDTSNNITITYEAGGGLTGDETTQGTRFGSMTVSNGGAGTTTLVLDDSDDKLPTGTANDDRIRAGGLLRVQAGTYTPDKHWYVQGGAVEQTGGLIQTRAYDLTVDEGTYTIDGGESNMRQVHLTGDQGASSMTVNTGGTLTVRDTGSEKLLIGGGGSAATLTVSGGTVNGSGNFTTRANGTIELSSGTIDAPRLVQKDGAVHQHDGTMDIAFERVVAAVQGQSATYNFNAGTGSGRNLLIGVSGRDGQNVGGAGTFQHTGGSLNVGRGTRSGEGVYVGHEAATQTSRYVLKGGSLSTNAMEVRSSGIFQGYSAVSTLASASLSNSGRIIADGDGTERTLDLSGFEDAGNDGGVENPADNPADGDNGYFATGQGKLVLPDVLNVQSSNGSTYNFGESQSDSSIDLINSARFTFNGLDDSGRSLSGSLLDPARSDVTTNGLDLISVHDFDLTGDSSVFDSFDLTIRYDQTALESGEESTLRLMHFDGSNWVDITSSRDTANNLITANGVGSFSQFGVTAVIPEPASLALLAPAGLLVLRRRRGTSS